MASRFQRCYGGVRFLGGAGPSPRNVAKLDMGAIPMVAHMAQRGLRVDLSHFAAMDITLTQDMDRVTEEVYTLTGYHCNLGSGAQVSDLLFKKLGLKQARVKFTKSKTRESVEEEVLLAIQHDHPAVSKILDYKEFDKLRGTYVRPLQKLARRTALGTWRMFPNFTTTRIPSGRFACKDPNLLAMPNRTARGREVCRGFITDEGWVYLSVDESQIEPRVVAHRSLDPALMAIYENEEDIYSDFAISAFKLADTRFRDETGWHYPGVDKKIHRFPSKTCILASIYEVTNKGLLEQMPIICKHCGISAANHNQDPFMDESEKCLKFEPVWNEDNCQDIINAFYIRYPGILEMRYADHARAKRFGFLWDDWGRVLHVVAVRSVLEWVVSAALREAGNFPIQSTACGTVKLVMAEVYDGMQATSMFDVAHPLLPIHDEILFECRANVADELAAYVSDCFEHCVRLAIPIKAGAARGPNWGDVPK